MEICFQLGSNGACFSTEAYISLNRVGDHKGLKTAIGATVHP